jgi:hypothetical protein
LQEIPILSRVLQYCGLAETQLALVWPARLAGPETVGSTTHSLTYQEIEMSTRMPYDNVAWDRNNAQFYNLKGQAV